MIAYSPDLRRRILRAVDSGRTKAAVARRCDVALSTVKRYLTQRVTASDQPKGVSGPAPRIGPDHRAALVAQVRATPAATLAEPAAAGEKTHGVRVSQWTMGRVSRRLPVT